MNTRRTIALALGGIATIAVFVLGLALLLKADYPSSSDRIIMVSVAIAPLAMCATMVGYGVWWMVMFLMTLFGPDEKSRPDVPRNKSG